MAVIVPKRYGHLFRLADEFRRKTSCLRFLEIGTWHGDRACQLARHWFSIGGDRFHYDGLDWFEHLPEDRKVEELSKPGPQPFAEQVALKLKSVPGMEFRLFVGDTRITVPYLVRGVLSEADLIFLDGGHSLHTIRSDWNNLSFLVRKGAVMLLDDYYENYPHAGCRRLVEELADSGDWKISILDPLDGPFGELGLKIRMVEVRS